MAITEQDEAGRKGSAIKTRAALPAYRFRPVPEAIVFGTAIFLAILLTTLFIHYSALEALKGEIRDGLARTGSVLAVNVDGDLHETIVSRSQEGEEAYERAIEPLRRTVLSDESIAFAYTLVLSDNKVFFVLDPTESGDIDGDGVDEKAHVMQEYRSPTEEMMTALIKHRQVTEKKPYLDIWGAFISGYTPIFNSDGKFVAILGLDIRADNYYKRLAPIRRSTARALVVGFFIAFISASSVWFLRNFSRIISISRLKIYGELCEIKQKSSQ
jgi:hypothetical protein